MAYLTNSKLQDSQAAPEDSNNFHYFFLQD